MVCSARKHPLSSVSGRRRYNTLDFPQENRVPTGRFRPYWKPRIKGICHPFEIPAVLKSVYTNRENDVCIYTSQNAKIPTVDPPTRRGKTLGIFKCRIHRTERNSCVTHRCGAAIFRTLTRVPAKVGCVYSTKPYLTLIRSSFSSIGSAAMRMKITVAAAWIRSIGRPDT